MARLLTRLYQPNITDADKAEAMRGICMEKPDEADEHRHATRRAHDLKYRYVISPQTFRHTTVYFDELGETIKKLPNNKATGLDTITNKMLKKNPKKNSSTTHLHHKCHHEIPILSHRMEKGGNNLH